jgi:hypothetical protein
MIEEMIVKLIEQAPSLAILVWLVFSLRQDVRYLTETIVELKVNLVGEEPEGEEND